MLLRGALQLLYSMLLEVLTDFSSASSLLDGLTHYPATYVFAYNVNSSVVRPIAYEVLAFCLALELVQITIRAAENTGNGLVILSGMFKLVIKYMLCKAVVDHCVTILLELFNISQNVTDLISGLAVDTSFSWPTSALENSINSLDSGLIGIGPLILLVICFLIAWLARICITVICTVRFIHLYVLFAFAPLPLATLMADGQWNMGISYIKGWLTACFHSCGLYFILKCYQSVAADIIGGSSTFVGACAAIAGVNIVLLVCLFSAEKLVGKLFT